MPLLASLKYPPSTVESIENLCCYFHPFREGHPPPPAEVLEDVTTSTRASGLWDNGAVITCSFTQPLDSKSARNMQRHVKETVKEWEKYANIRFVFIDSTSSDSDSASEHDRLSEAASLEERRAVVRINLGPYSDWWTFLSCDVESVPKGTPTMNLVFTNPTSTVLRDDEKGPILHQFGHMLGFLDDHKNPRIEETVALNEEGILEYFLKSLSWDREQILRRWRAYRDDELGAVFPVDLKSIMMFHLLKEFTLDGVEVPPNYSLSPLDKALAFLHYPYMRGDIRPEGAMDIDEALEVSGITGESRESMLRKYQLGDWRGMREELVQLSKGDKM